MLIQRKALYSCSSGNIDSVLGIISYNNMTAVFPQWSFLSVVVVTTYPKCKSGKSRQIVTRPLEAVLSTSSGLKNISSYQ